MVSNVTSCLVTFQDGFLVERNEAWIYGMSAWYLTLVLCLALGCILAQEVTRVRA